LGVHATTIEVNPFLADLIEAKLTSYSATQLAKEFGQILTDSTKAKCPSSMNRPALPKTFVEPGDKGRWIFSSEAAEEVFRLFDAINRISAAPSRRLFRVLLGGILTDVSNVRISGKGPRYRSGWERNQRCATDVRQAFINACHEAIAELHSYRQRPELG
jgi:hypothetical protein